MSYQTLNLFRLPLLILLTLSASGSAANISLYEVHFSSWSGDRIRQFSLQSINQAARDVLACASLAVNYLLNDQLLVFIGGNSAQESQCILASRSAGLCRVLPEKPTQPSCCIRVFVRSMSNCWTTIQRRVDNSTDFYRNWTEYAEGFGQGPHGNYWIGLRSLRNLTWSTPRLLRVRMKTWDNTEYWAEYTSFSVASEAHKFRLSISGFRNGLGNLGDSITGFQNGMKFSTFDSDNDASSDNCAIKFHGAWWYGACHTSNPNGFYFTALQTPGYAVGIVWCYPFGYYFSMKEFEMHVL